MYGRTMMMSRSRLDFDAKRMISKTNFFCMCSDLTQFLEDSATFFVRFYFFNHLIKSLESRFPLLSNGHLTLDLHGC